MNRLKLSKLSEFLSSSGSEFYTGVENAAKNLDFRFRFSKKPKNLKSRKFRF